MNSFLVYIVLAIHILGATIWVGGHIIVMLAIVPRAVREKKASIILEFEKRYEPIGMPALLMQFITGFILAWNRLGDPTKWFVNDPIAHAVQAKLGLLLLTIAIAIKARTRLIPNLTDDNVRTLAWHVRVVTFAAIFFVLVGASIRSNGFPLFTLHG